MKQIETSLQINKISIWHASINASQESIDKHNMDSL